MQCMETEARAPKADVKAVAGTPHWYREAPPHRSRTVLVFVHGILSSNDKCWKKKKGFLKKNKAVFYWPQICLNDPQLGEPDIYLAGYPSGLTAGKFETDDAAVGLIKAMENAGVFKRNRIVLVCHSQGGIVGRRIVLKCKSILKGKQLGLFLCASPSWGTRLGNLLGIFGKVIGFSQSYLLAHGDPTLVQLDKDFQDLLADDPVLPEKWKPTGYCLVEAKRFFWSPLFMVSDESAARYFPWARLSENHRSIVKPDGQSHASHTALVYFCISHLFVTVTEFSNAIERFKDAVTRVLRVCSTGYSSSIDEKWRALQDMKAAASEVVSLAPHDNRTFLDDCIAIRDTAEFYPDSNDGGREWPLRDITREQLGDFLNSLST